MEIQDEKQLQEVEHGAGSGDLDDITERPQTETIYLNGELAVATTEALQQFLNEISRERLLTREEEASLARRIERGDRKARERMIRSNLALVVSIEVATEARLTLEQVREVQEAPRTVVSLDQPVSAQDETPLGELVPDERLAPAEAVVISLHKAELRDAHRRAVSTLPERDCCSVELRYGLDGGEPTTLAEIGRRPGLTRERIRQIELEALERLARERERQGLYAAA